MKEEKGIILSEKHGLNASISVCFLCGKDIGIVLFGKLEGDKEAPKKCCTGELCDDCKAKLISNKEVVICDDIGRYVTVPEEHLTPEGLTKANEFRSLFISSKMFDNIFANNDKN